MVANIFLTKKSKRKSFAVTETDTWFGFRLYWHDFRELLKRTSIFFKTSKKCRSQLSWIDIIPFFKITHLLYIHCHSSNTSLRPPTTRINARHLHYNFHYVTISRIVFRHFLHDLSWIALNKLCLWITLKMWRFAASDSQSALKCSLIDGRLRDLPHDYSYHVLLIDCKK